MKAKNTYIALGVVFVASVTAALLLPVAETIRVLAAVPAIASLFGALLQIFRDRIAHERSLWILEAQNSFSMGATSHMAEVAFDKYSQFCEEYVAEMFRALTTLNRDGPRPTVLPHASALSEIRKKWSLWLTPALEAKLDPFEAALRKMGASAYLLESVPGHPEAIKIMYSLFAEILGFEKWEETPISGDLTVTAVINRLREVLGTDELNLLQSELVRRALAKMQDSR